MSALICSSQAASIIERSSTIARTHRAWSHGLSTSASSHSGLSGPRGTGFLSFDDDLRGSWPSSIQPIHRSKDGLIVASHQGHTCCSTSLAQKKSTTSELLSDLYHDGFLMLSLQDVERIIPDPASYSSEDLARMLAAEFSGNSENFSKNSSSRNESWTVHPASLDLSRSCSITMGQGDTWQAACGQEGGQEVAQTSVHLTALVVPHPSSASDSSQEPTTDEHSAPTKATRHTTGLYVYPRSHWLVSDWLAAARSSSEEKEVEVERWQEGQADGGWLPVPGSVPVANALKIALAPGEILLLHPWLLWRPLPPPSSPAQPRGVPGYLPLPRTVQATIIAVQATETAVRPREASELPLTNNKNVFAFHLVGKRQEKHEQVEEKGHPVWAHWPSLTTSESASSRLKFREFSPSLALVGLQYEERKAEEGNWAVKTKASALNGGAAEIPEGHSPDSEGNLAKGWTYVAPRDLLAMDLRKQIERLFADEQWDEALPLVRKLPGLHNNSAWAFYQAGFCLSRCVPPGQLAGRAGRKCLLEDCERYLLRAIDLAPCWPEPYIELMHCLQEMGRGREEEVPEWRESMALLTGRVPENLENR